MHDEAEFRAFLVRAKRATYAGKGPERAASRPQSHDLYYAEGAYAYLDTYLGGERFSGEEAVWKDGTPVWAMNYSGRVTGAGFSGDFLKEALLHLCAHTRQRYRAGQREELSCGAGHHRPNAGYL